MKRILNYLSRQKIRTLRNSALKNGYAKEITSQTALKECLRKAFLKMQTQVDSKPLIVVEPKTLKRIEVKLENGQFKTTILEE